MASKAFSSLFGNKKPQMTVAQDYQKWRESIFTVKPEQVDVSPNNPNQVYGIIMDMGQNDPQTATNWVISVSAFPTGEAAFHPSTGKGNVIFPGDGDPHVAKVAQELVLIAQALLPESSPAKDFALPEPGIVQFFLLTPNGARVCKGHLEKLQKSENPFAQVLNLFDVIRQRTDQILDEGREFALKAVYVMAFTPEKMEQPMLMAVTRIAWEMLEAKNPIFKRRIDKWAATETRMEIANIQYIPTMHTFNKMNALMSNWIKNQYNVTIKPSSYDFFLHGMRNPQGKEMFFLFYFDVEY